LVFDLVLQRFLEPADGGVVGELSVHERAEAGAMKKLVDVEAGHGTERRAAVNDRKVHDARVPQHETAA